MANDSQRVCDPGVLTVREVAYLSGASIPSVKKALQQGKLSSIGATDRRLTPRAVLAMALAVGLDARLSTAAQQRLQQAIFVDGTEIPAQIGLSEVLFVRVPDVVRQKHQAAAAYVAARDALLERRASVLGGMAIVVGTRLSAQSLAARLDGGDTLDSLVDDYPVVSIEAIQAAVTFGRTHPPVGRPSGLRHPSAQ